MNTGREALSAQSVTDVTFPTARKGLDPAAVHQHLVQVSATVNVLHQRIAELEAQMQVLTTPVIDEAVVARFLGTESARLLTRAQDAANELTAGAERRANSAIHQAEESAADIRRIADQETGRQRKETDAECSELQESAQEQAFQLVKEAEDHRRRILDDVHGRRQRAVIQLEGLMDGRDQLVESIAALRSYAELITHDLADFRLDPAPFTSVANTIASERFDVENAASTIVRASLTGAPDTEEAPH